MASVVCAATPAVRAPARAFAGLKQTPAGLCKPAAAQQFVAVRRSVKPAKRAAVQTQAAAEVFQVASEAGYIFGVSGVMGAITLIGLAFGFVLLRVESLAEEGKI